MKLFDYLLREGEGKPSAPAAKQAKITPKGSSQGTVSVLIHGRQSAEMKAFKDAREKDPRAIVGQFGIKGGVGWAGVLAACQSMAGAEELGSVINGAELIDNRKNTKDGEKPTLGIMISCDEVWSQGHENSQVSKKLVAWWVKQVLRGAFESGLIKPYPSGQDDRYKKAGFKRWDSKWKIYEFSDGGILVFYGRQSDWNSDAESREF